MAAGAGGRGSRPARVAHCSNRGLTQVWHASESGIELRPLGLVMLGFEDHVENVVKLCLDFAIMEKLCTKEDIDFTTTTLGQSLGQLLINKIEF